MKTRGYVWWSVFGAGVVLLAAVVNTSCDDTQAVIAKQIRSRSDLIGGPGALGEVGDYLLANERIRVIIQDEDYSRGFGLYGGSLIDADLVRPGSFGDSSGGLGRDNFSELFPGLFLLAMKPDEDGVRTVRHDDGSASVEVRGRAADFVFLAAQLNDVLVDADNLRFTNEYRLRPGVSYVEITTTVTNFGSSRVEFPSEGASSLIGDAELVFPVGDVVLFGAGNEVFAEGAGFDIRFTLEELYRTPVELPRLPGLVTPFLATRGPGVSYGFMSGVSEPDGSLVGRAGYENASVDDLVIPFLASAFTGAFYGAAPEGLERGESFSFKKYFLVGRGDVASIRDVVHQIRGTETGRVSGVVKERLTQAPEAEADVVLLDSAGRPVNQIGPDDRGRFTSTMPPGRYRYVVVADGRFVTDPVAFEVRAGASTFLEIELESPGLVSVQIQSAEDGRRIPGKCTFVGTYPAPAPGRPGRDFLYDLRLGERWRPLDLVSDTEDPSTRRFVEEVVVAPEGRILQRIRPGNYRVVCSRGPEYDLYERDVEVVAGATRQVTATLSRVVDTAGWASADFHLHSVNSVDSSMSLPARVAAVAAEGVDVASSSDHNFVTDYRAAISDQNLQSWVQGMVGLEMTPLEIGHFNAFPLRFQPGPITNGSFEWSGRPPQELFDELRALGRYGPEQTIVQVNHPRDTILGYFNDYNFNPDSGEVEQEDSVLLAPTGPEFGPENFSFDFDAIEVFNGKRYELLFHYRVPDELPPPPLPENVPPAGTVLRDDDGRVAFPGAMNDWYTMLKTGRIYTATGNSDTHGPRDEPGFPRTFVPVSDDRPGAIAELEVVDALRRGRAVPTMGPLLIVTATTSGGCRDRRPDLQETSVREGSACGMGEVALAPDGAVRLEAEMRVAPWIRVDRLVVRVNGDVVETFDGDNASLSRIAADLTLSADGFVIVEAIGDTSMFPVVVPNEVPSIQVSDALGSITAAFGVDLRPFGNLFPRQETIVFPYAFTNPIFVDVDGNGRFDPPGTRQQALEASRAPRVEAKRRSSRHQPAMTKILGIFGHGHPH